MLKDTSRQKQKVILKTEGGPLLSIYVKYIVTAVVYTGTVPHRFIC